VLEMDVRRGGTNNSLFNRIGGCTVLNAVLISDIHQETGCPYGHYAVLSSAVKRYQSAA
jgi:hypothetical protein